MGSKYQEAERAKAIVGMKKNQFLFEGDQGGGKFYKIEREFVLKDREKNLYGPIREEALEYFEKNRIGWWGGRKPTGHVLSSQIACVNHLYPLRDDREMVLKIARKISSDFVDVLKIETDEHLSGYIQFEAVSDNDNLNEGTPNRGNNCTSIDALIYARHRDGSKWLIPIEWKYTEHYDNANKAMEGCKTNPDKCKGITRKERYTDLINRSKQLTADDHSTYYYEPFYQLMRQTLWTEQMIHHRTKETIKGENFIHVHVVPRENRDLLCKAYKCSGLDMETTWRKQLKDQSKYRIISPEELLSVINGSKDYAHLRKYLSERYWT